MKRRPAGWSRFRCACRFAARRAPRMRANTAIAAPAHASSRTCSARGSLCRPAFAMVRSCLHRHICVGWCDGCCFAFGWTMPRDACSTLGSSGAASCIHMYTSRLVVSVVLSLTFAPTAFAQPANSNSSAAAANVATASRATEAPAIDGDVLGDPAWANATPITGFTQEQPNEGEPVSERTEVRVLFTNDTLYIGAVMHDSEPSGIVISDARRDSPLDDTDSFQVIVDTYRDRQNGFVFGTNPAGVEYEGQGGGGLGPGQMQQGGSGAGFNINWDAAWVVRTSVGEHGWSAEFAIPFRTLRYPASADQTWGINFQRNIRRKNERSYWAPIPRQFNLYRLSLAGSITGVQTPPPRNFRITPYALGNVFESGVRPVGTDTDYDFGGDVKYSITPSLTLDATVNTDFAQVEVDDQQVNLDRFTLFFPEKRPFFLENAGFFSVGNPGEVDLFFSRRIGLGDSGEEIPILGGGRVSGKVGLWNVGILDMQTEEVGAEPSNNFGVLRVSRELPNRSAFGGIFVNRAGSGDVAPDNDHNRTYAVDGKWGIGRNSLLSGFLAKTDTPGIESDDHAFNLRGRILYPHWDLDAGYQEVGEQFNPEVGFLSRRGYRKPDVRVMTRFRPKAFLKLQEIRPHATYRGFWGVDTFQET